MSEKGVKYDKDKPRWELLPWKQVAKVVEVITYGAKKYSADNWKFVDKKRYIGALHRHLYAWFNGEKFDEESSYQHLAHAGCCLLFIMAHEDLQDVPEDFGKQVVNNQNKLDKNMEVNDLVNDMNIGYVKCENCGADLEYDINGEDYVDCDKCNFPHTNKPIEKNCSNCGLSSDNNGTGLPCSQHPLRPGGPCGYGAPEDVNYPHWVPVKAKPVKKKCETCHRSSRWADTCPSGGCGADYKLWEPRKRGNTCATCRYSYLNNIGKFHCDEHPDYPGGKCETLDDGTLSNWRPVNART